MLMPQMAAAPSPGIVRSLFSPSGASPSSPAVAVQPQLAPGPLGQARRASVVVGSTVAEEAALDQEAPMRQRFGFRKPEVALAKRGLAVAADHDGPNKRKRQDVAAAAGGAVVEQTLVSGRGAPPPPSPALPRVARPTRSSERDEIVLACAREKILQNCSRRRDRVLAGYVL
jgi:hypothetical protein